MKKVKLLLTTAVIVFATMICCPMSAFALTDGDWEFQLLDNEVEITNYLGDDEDVIIPETLYGAPVTKVTGDTLDPYLVHAKKVTFPNTVKVIDKWVISDAISGNAALETVIIPEGVEEICEAAFYKCHNLKNIILPSTIKKIGYRAFENCTLLSSVNFPDGIESVGSKAFRRTGLTELDLTNINPEYGESVFSTCEALRNVKLNYGLTEISEGMFYGCKSLETIDIPSTVTKICEHAFYECTALKNVILPTSLKVLEDYCFAKTGLIEVVIPYGTELFHGDIFDDCKNLKSIYIPDTTNIYGTSIGHCPNAIVYCTANSIAAGVCKENKISYLTDNSVNSGIHVLYNGTRISFHSYGQNPELLESRTLVPLRSIFEAMGADVEWDGATNTAIAKRGNVEVKITIGANEIYKNGKAVPVDVPAMLLNSRTMVPARVIAEAFGADVQWNGNGRVVLITE